MAEDRERCVAVGMDAHLGKPIDPGQLEDCLRRYLKPHSSRHEVDFDALRTLTDGDRQFERDLIETFVNSGDQCLKDILAALCIGDLATLGTRAHSLKGTSANIHAHRLSDAASSVENAARMNVIGDLDGLVKQLSASLQAASAELLKFG